MLQVKSANGCHRARRASRSAADEALGYRLGGALGTDRIGSDLVSHKRGGACTRLPGAHLFKN